MYKTLNCLFVLLVATSMLGCAGLSPMKEPDELDDGQVSKTMEESRSRGLYLGEYRFEPAVLVVGGYRVRFGSAWVESKTRYEWRAFFARLVKERGKQVVVINHFTEQESESPLIVRPVGNPPLFTHAPIVGRDHWYCVVTKAPDVIELEARESFSGQTTRFVLTRVETAASRLLKNPRERGEDDS